MLCYVVMTLLSVHVPVTVSTVNIQQQESRAIARKPHVIIGVLGLGYYCWP